jgi:hypothetical protein
MTSSSSTSDLLIFIGIIILLWILWFATGGPARFLASQNENSTSNTSIQNIFSPPWEKSTHPYANAITLTPSGVHNTDPDTEYITLSLAWTAPGEVNLTGWKLRNKNGDEVLFEWGAHTPRQGIINPTEDIILRKGGSAIITTGDSPLGISFGVNLCSGYLGTLQTFTPHLSTPCPSALDMAKEKDVDIDDKPCQEALERVPACTTYIGSIPEGISSTCADFMKHSIHYNECVNVYHKLNTFELNEWRVFLHNDEELWDNKTDTISLYDENGVIVTGVTY